MSTLMPSALTPSSVVIVDWTVSDYSTLVAGIDPNTPVIVLQPGESGLAGLAAALAGFENLDAIHLVTHGWGGALQLGGQLVTSDSLSSQVSDVMALATALKPGGDLLLYGCSVAAGTAGRQFMDDLSALLGDVDIAASTDRTGPTRLGGDWDLEYRVGEIESTLPFTMAGMEDISHCLGCSVGTTGEFVKVRNVFTGMSYDWYGHAIIHDQLGVVGVAFGQFNENVRLSAQFNMLPEHQRKNVTITAGSEAEAVNIFYKTFLPECLPQPDSITLLNDPAANARSLTFQVSFDGPVSNVGINDFALATGNTSGTITDVSGSGAVYTVTVSNVSGQGTIRLKLADDNSVTKDGVPLTYQSPAQSPVHTVDVIAPILGSAPGGSQRITGDDGNNWLVATDGNNSIDGGDGIDVVRFAGNAADFTVTHRGDGAIIVTDRRVGGTGGSDILHNVEILSFNDGTCLLSLHDGPMARFDEALYRYLNPDVDAAIISGLFADAHDHATAFGNAEGRLAMLLVDETFYRQQNPDVDAAILAGQFTSAAAHFVFHGMAEGRDPNALFNTGWYLFANPDVAAAVASGLTTAWQHFNEFGWREDRDPSLWFDISAHLALHGDVAASDMNPLAHFLDFGIHEGRLAPGSDGGLWGGLGG